MRKREVQVEILNAGKVDARKREELLEFKRVAAEKKTRLEEQQKSREEKKRRAKEEWQKNVRLAEEEKKREDKIQLDKCLAKTLALEEEAVVNKKAPRRDLTSEELDQEFWDLNAGQVKANAWLVVEQLVEQRGVGRKKKMQRQEEG